MQSPPLPILLEPTHKRAALTAQLHDTPASAAPVSLDALAAQLRAVPALIDHATIEERQFILSRLFSQVYARPTVRAPHGAVLALRPTQLFAPILVKSAIASMHKTSAWSRECETEGGLPLLLDWNAPITVS